MILSAIVCGAIYMVVTPPPATERVETETRSRTLAYQEKIARAAEEVQEEQAAAPQAAAPAETAPDQGAQSATAPETGPVPSGTGEDATEMAGLPPGEDVPSDPNALPWQRPGSPNPQDSRGVDGAMPDPTGREQQAYGDPMGREQQAYGDPQAYRDPQAYGDAYDPRAPRRYGDPYGRMPPRPGPYGAPNDPRAQQRDTYGDPYDPMAGEPPYGDPNAWPGRPDERPQEWVQVLVSGVGMHGTASEDSPMLFAFPYGRVLRVVSRYGDWVEVTDPNSATTGWMQARYLAPVAAPGARQAAGPSYEQERRRGRRWWRRIWRNF